jgi:hypothetical protein
MRSALPAQPKMGSHTLLIAGLACAAQDGFTRVVEAGHGVRLRRGPGRSRLRSSGGTGRACRPVSSRRRAGALRPQHPAVPGIAYNAVSWTAGGINRLGPLAYRAYLSRHSSGQIQSRGTAVALPQIARKIATRDAPEFQATAGIFVPNPCPDVPTRANVGVANGISGGRGGGGRTMDSLTFAFIAPLPSLSSSSRRSRG